MILKVSKPIQVIFYTFLRDVVRNNLPRLMVIFSLIKGNFLRNHGLFKRNSTQRKGNRIINLGRLFLTASLKLSLYIPPTHNSWLNIAECELSVLRNKLLFTPTMNVLTTLLNQRCTIHFLRLRYAHQLQNSRRNIC
jgi:hypothetical protein